MISMHELMCILMIRSNGLFKISGSVREMSWFTSSDGAVEMWVHDPYQMSKPIMQYNFTKADICSLIKNQRLVAGSHTCEIARPRW